MALRTASLTVVILALAATVDAQPHAESYAMGAIGHGAIVIGGAEAVVKDVLGVGGEGGLFLAPVLGAFALSSGVTLRLPVASATRPFASAGGTYQQWYMGSFRGFYIGGGLDYRFTRTRGLRFEVRSHAGRGYYSSDRIVTLRAGMTFR